MRKRLLCTAVALSAWGCSDGSTPPAVATSVAVTPGTVSLDAVGARQVVRASVSDQDGDPMTGAALTWSSSSAAVTVAGAGGDSAFVTAAGNGSATITAVSGSASGTASAQVAQVAATIVKVSGDTQTGAVAAPLAQPLRVSARDRLGAPAAGITVTFAVVDGGGTLSTTSAVTGADGTATVTWSLGTTAGFGHRVSATAAGVTTPVEFTATANAGAPVAAAVGTGGGQTASPGSNVAVAPSVVVRDVHGNGVEGVTVQFTVSSGGGSVTGATATSGLGGHASVGSWRLGAGTGANTLTATFPGTSIPAVVITATASALGTVTITAGQNQGAMVGTAVPDAPSVVVRDGVGAPLAGITVTFAVTAGGGSVGNATATTNASGVASAGNWVMGPVGGPNTLRASVAGITATPAEFRGTGCEGGGAGYRMTLCFTTPMTSSQRAVFQNAAARWATVVTGDLPDLSGDIPQGSCGTGSPALDLTFDDLLIFAGISAIDGPGNVLGQAGWCYRRTGGLPVIGVMQFDAADVAGLEANGQFGSVILHEMGHVVGIGTLWSAMGLLQNPSSTGNVVDTWFSGSNALVGFNEIGGSTYTGGQKVPVENTGGPGTANGHWRESLLARELMTGYLNNGSNPLSALTVRSLIDLGYTVNTATAEPFSVTLSLQAEGAASSAGLKMHNDLYRGPRFTIDRQGRRTRLPN